jgi:hypothetical protein
VLAGESKVNIGYPTCPRHDCGVPLVGLRIWFLGGGSSLLQEQNVVERGPEGIWRCLFLVFKEVDFEAKWYTDDTLEWLSRMPGAENLQPPTARKSGLFYFVLDKTSTQTTTESQQPTQCLLEGTPTCQISNAGSQVESRSRSEMLSTKFPRTLEEPHEAMFSSRLADH